MEINEIITEALHYPLNHIQSLAIYLILGIVFSLIAIFTGVAGMLTVSQTSGPGIIVTLIGVLLCLIIYFIVSGYQLDIIKLGINRSSDAPSVDITRQTLNGVKLFVVQLVYFIVPIIISLVCALILNRTITVLIAFVLFVIFGFVETMGECRLAKTEDLNFALQVSDAIEDIKRIGFSKVLITIIAVGVIYVIISYIVSAVFGIISQDLAAVVSTIVSVYLLFFENRATGLLYSDLY